MDSGGYWLIFGGYWLMFVSFRSVYLVVGSIDIVFDLCAYSVHVVCFFGSTSIDFIHIRSISSDFLSMPAHIRSIFRSSSVGIGRFLVDAD